MLDICGQLISPTQVTHLTLEPESSADSGVKIHLRGGHTLILRGVTDIEGVANIIIKAMRRQKHGV